MKDTIEIPKPSSEVFHGWLTIKILSRIPKDAHSAGTVVTVAHEPPNGYVEGIRQDDLLQVSVKIRQDRCGKKYRQVVAVHRALRPAEMKEQAEAFLEHAGNKCGNDVRRVTINTFEGGLNGGIELDIDPVSGAPERVLLISACLDNGCHLAYTVENEGGNAEPAVPTFLGALCQALEIFYSWQLYDAREAYKQESE